MWFRGRLNFWRRRGITPVEGRSINQEVPDGVDGRFRVGDHGIPMGERPQPRRTPASTERKPDNQLPSP